MTVRCEEGLVTEEDVPFGDTMRICGIPGPFELSFLKNQILSRKAPESYGFT